LELLHLAGRLVALHVATAARPVRKPRAVCRARWMAKVIYALKMELLHDRNETVLKLTPPLLQGEGRVKEEWEMEGYGGEETVGRNKRMRGGKRR
jgi:hypothetical protein